ncbi:MAG: hypothetical protein COA32_07150 [Fluviicola sp.]|nr:MAG: hypothetical protein COA32_07150 [Fluviicola sp.]
MKNLYFNRKTSVLRNKDEKPRKKRNTNWDKIIYFAVLLTIVYFVFSFFFVRLVYVDAPGHVLFKSLSIRVPEDITIHNIYKEEGELICEGDTLFSYISTKDELMAMSSINADIANKGNQWMEREIYSLKKDIGLNNIDVFEKQQLIEWNEARIKEIEDEVVLGITPKYKLENYQKDIEKLTLEIENIEAANATYRNLITTLQQANNTNPSSIDMSQNGFGGLSYLQKYYIAPIEGTATRIYKNNFEVALKSENILNIHKREDIYIKAFFDQEDFHHVNEGDQVRVIFPDGEESIGHIKRFYFASYRLPEEFQKKYESTTRAIAADIFPIEREDQIKWKAFYKMKVNVRISKY